MITDVHTFLGATKLLYYTVVLSLVSWSGIASSLSNMIPDLHWFKQKKHQLGGFSWIKPTPSWWINSSNHHLVYVWGSATFFRENSAFLPINPGDEFHPNHDPIRQGAGMKRGGKPRASAGSWIFMGSVPGTAVAALGPQGLVANLETMGNHGKIKGKHGRIGGKSWEHHWTSWENHRKIMKHHTKTMGKLLRKSWKYMGAWDMYKDGVVGKRWKIPLSNESLMELIHGHVGFTLPISLPWFEVTTNVCFLVALNFPLPCSMRVYSWQLVSGLYQLVPGTWDMLRHQFLPFPDRKPRWHSWDNFGYRTKPPPKKVVPHEWLLYVFHGDSKLL